MTVTHIGTVVIQMRRARQIQEINTQPTNRTLSPLYEVWMGKGKADGTLRNSGEMVEILGWKITR